jgi:hypothetical protein
VKPNNKGVDLSSPSTPVPKDRDTDSPVCASYPNGPPAPQQLALTMEHLTRHFHEDFTAKHISLSDVEENNSTSSLAGDSPLFSSQFLAPPTYPFSCFCPLRFPFRSHYVSISFSLTLSLYLSLTHSLFLSLSFSGSESTLGGGEFVYDGFEFVGEGFECSVDQVRYTAVRYSVEQFMAVQCSTVWWSTVPCSVVQHSTAQRSTVQCGTLEYSTVQDGIHTSLHSLQCHVTITSPRPISIILPLLPSLFTSIFTILTLFTFFPSSLSFSFFSRSFSIFSSLFALLPPPSLR